MIKKYAPETFQELQGYAAHPEFNLTQMLMMSYQWEMVVLGDNLDVGDFFFLKIFTLPAFILLFHTSL